MENIIHECATASPTTMSPTTTSTLVQFPEKICSGDCSGHGLCLIVFDDSVTNFRSTQRCTIVDTDCEAVCSCSLGFTGERCEYTHEEIRERQQIKDEIISWLLKMFFVTLKLSFKISIFAS